MLRSGIINPHVLSLVARIRHTNALVIADWAFPAWPDVETVDLSLITGVPTVPQVLGAILAHWQSDAAYMAEEFRKHNPPQVQELFSLALRGVPVHYEPHIDFKKRIPGALGLIRTGDSTVYSNIILISG